MSTFTFSITLIYGSIFNDIQNRFMSQQRQLCIEMLFGHKKAKSYAIFLCFCFLENELRAWRSETYLFYGLILTKFRSSNSCNRLQQCTSLAETQTHLRCICLFAFKLWDFPMVSSQLPSLELTLYSDRSAGVKECWSMLNY